MKRHVYNPDALRTGPGVYTLDDVKDRCKVDDLTGCWIWGMSSAGGENPRVHVPKNVIIGFERGGALSAARVTWLMSNKRGIPIDFVVWRKCDTPGCINPAHRIAGSRAQMCMWYGEQGAWRGDPLRSVINRKNTLSQALTQEAVRCAEGLIAEGRSSAEIAAEMRVHVSTISRIRSGQHMHQRAIIGSSVFSMVAARGVR